MRPSQEAAIWNILEDEHVDEDTVIGTEVVEVSEYRPFLANARQSEVIVLCGPRKAEDITLAECRIEAGSEPSQPLPRHVDVHIIIPRDETMVPDGPEAGPAAQSDVNALVCAEAQDVF